MTLSYITHFTTSKYRPDFSRFFLYVIPIMFFSVSTKDSNVLFFPPKLEVSFNKSHWNVYFLFLFRNANRFRCRTNVHIIWTTHIVYSEACRPLFYTIMDGNSLDLHRVCVTSTRWGSFRVEHLLFNCMKTYHSSTLYRVRQRVIRWKIIDFSFDQ